MPVRFVNKPDRHDGQAWWQYFFSSCLSIMTVRFVTSSHKNVCPLLIVKSEFLGYNECKTQNLTIQFRSLVLMLLYSWHRHRLAPVKRFRGLWMKYQIDLKCRARVRWVPFPGGHHREKAMMWYMPFGRDQIGGRKRFGFFERIGEQRSCPPNYSVLKMSLRNRRGAIPLGRSIDR